VHFDLEKMLEILLSENHLGAAANSTTCVNVQHMLWFHAMLLLCCMLCLCYKHNLHLCVTLMDCDYTVQQKLDIGTCQRRCLGYLLAEADLDCSILWSRILVRKTGEVWKMWIFALWQCIQRNAVAVSQHVRSLMYVLQLVDVSRLQYSYGLYLNN